MKRRILMVLAVMAILTVGAVHVIDAKDSFEEAAYKGWLFYANGLASVIVAVAIIKNIKWGWYFGFLVAGGSIVAYIASRTVGLPMIPAEPDAWFEPLGVVAMVSEMAFVILAWMSLINKDA